MLHGHHAAGAAGEPQQLLLGQQPSSSSSQAAAAALTLHAPLPQLDALVVGQAAQAPQAALSALLAAVVLVGVLDGLSQGAIFGDAAALPPTFTHVSACLMRCIWCVRACVH